jgi:hypothetical protein
MAGRPAGVRRDGGGGPAKLEAEAFPTFTLTPALSRREREEPAREHRPGLAFAATDPKPAAPQLVVCGCPSSTSFPARVI